MQLSLSIISHCMVNMRLTFSSGSVFQGWGGGGCSCLVCNAAKAAVKRSSLVSISCALALVIIVLELVGELMAEVWCAMDSNWCAVLTAMA